MHINLVKIVIKGIGGGLEVKKQIFSIHMLFSGFSRFQNGLVELSKVYRTYFIVVWISAVTRELWLLSALFPIHLSIYFRTQNGIFGPLKWVLHALKYSVYPRMLYLYVFYVKMTLFIVECSYFSENFRKMTNFYQKLRKSQVFGQKLKNHVSKQFENSASPTNVIFGPP